MRNLCFLLTLVATLLLPGRLIAAALPQDEKLITGQLDNDLRYMIYPHAHPKDQVNLWLQIHTGSLQEEDNVQQPRNIFLIRDVVMHKTHKHKHQCDENRNAEEGVQNASHLRRTEGLRQPLQRREEERNPGQRHQEEANHHGPVTGAINKFGAHNHFRLTHDDPPRHRPLPYSGQYRCSGKSTRQKWQ